MNLKICSKCGKSKVLDNFYFRKKGTRVGKYYEKCKDCMKARGISYYHKNHERQLKLAILRSNILREKMLKYMDIVKNKPCMDCGGRFPSCAMDFDHRDGDGKENNISRMSNGGWSKIKIDEEIKKCDLVCANCHRIRTFKRHAEVAKVVKALV